MPSRIPRRFYFNSRPSARGDCRGRCADRADEIFQFTPLREGRPRPHENGLQPSEFQFTPLREGRPLGQLTLSFPFYFNSRPSARGDLFRGQWLSCRTISIHAPPRGATPVRDCRALIAEFQFTPLREGRPGTLNVAGDSALFQFTPLREGRQSSLRRLWAWIGDFNSRPSARGDRRQVAAWRCCWISIHAPPRGATA